MTKNTDEVTLVEALQETLEDEQKRIKELTDALALEQAGREQDRAELKMAIEALWDICESSFKPWYCDADRCHKRAERALKDMGVAVEIKPGVWCDRDNVPKGPIDGITD